MLFVVIVIYRKTRQTYFYCCGLQCLLNSAKHFLQFSSELTIYTQFFVRQISKIIIFEEVFFVDACGLLSLRLAFKTSVYHLLQAIGNLLQILKEKEMSTVVGIKVKTMEILPLISKNNNNVKD